MHPSLRILIRAMFAFMLIWQPMLQIQAQTDTPETLFDTTTVNASITDELLIDVGDIPTGLTTTPDGRLLIALKYGAIKVFDFQSGRIIKGCKSQIVSK